MLRSEEINDPLHGLCGETVRTKTFRTWKGSHAAFAFAARRSR